MFLLIFLGFRIRFDLVKKIKKIGFLFDIIVGLLFVVDLWCVRILNWLKF